MLQFSDLPVLRWIATVAAIWIGAIWMWRKWRPASFSAAFFFRAAFLGFAMAFVLAPTLLVTNWSGFPAPATLVLEAFCFDLELWNAGSMAVETVKYAGASFARTWLVVTALVLLCECWRITAVRARA